MRWIAGFSLLLAAGGAGAQDARELWRQGFQVVAEYGYVEVEECEPDKPIRLEGGRYFECSGYEYPYHYGDAILVAKTVNYRGHDVRLYYLCLEGGDCLAGSVLTLR